MAKSTGKKSGGGKSTSGKGKPAVEPETDVHRANEPMTRQQLFRTREFKEVTIPKLFEDFRNPPNAGDIVDRLNLPGVTEERVEAVMREDEIVPAGWVDRALDIIQGDPEENPRWHPEGFTLPTADYEAYLQSRSQVAADVHKTLGRLVKKGLIERVEPGDGGDETFKIQEPAASKKPGRPRAPGAPSSQWVRLTNMIYAQRLGERFEPWLLDNHADGDSTLVERWKNGDTKIPDRIREDMKAHAKEERDRAKVDTAANMTPEQIDDLNRFRAILGKRVNLFGNKREYLDDLKSTGYPYSSMQVSKWLARAEPVPTEAIEALLEIEEQKVIRLPDVHRSEIQQRIIGQDGDVLLDKALLDDLDDIDLDAGDADEVLRAKAEELEGNRYLAGYALARFSDIPTGKLFEKVREKHERDKAAGKPVEQKIADYAKRYFAKSISNLWRDHKAYRLTLTEEWPDIEDFLKKNRTFKGAAVSSEAIILASKSYRQSLRGEGSSTPRPSGAKKAGLKQTAWHVIDAWRVLREEFDKCASSIDSILSDSKVSAEKKKAVDRSLSGLGNHLDRMNALVTALSDKIPDEAAVQVVQRKLNEGNVVNFPPQGGQGDQEPERATVH